MKTIRTEKVALFSLWLGALLLRKLINFGTLIGSHYFVVITPLLGSFLSLGQTSSVLASLLFIKIIFNAFPVTLYLPTMGATLSWAIARENKNNFLHLLTDTFLHIALPITCIALFVIHPVGSQAPIYALYWLIPMVLYILRYIKNNNTGIFVFALQSTFIAHALGSIIWLYTQPTTSGYWLTLIPIVAIERLTIAGISTLVFVGLKKTVSLYQTRFNKHQEIRIV